MSHARRLAPVLVALAFATAAQAQEKCRVEQTIQECWNVYLPEPAAAAAKTAAATQANEAAKSAEEAVKKKETGLEGGVPALATTTRNLLPFLTLTGLLSDSDGNTKDNLLSVDLNFLIGRLAKDNNAQLKAVLNTKPALFGPVKEALAATTGGADRVKQAEDGLDSADDYLLSFTYNHTSKKWGRSFQQYLPKFSELLEATISSVGEGSQSAFTDFVAKNEAAFGNEPITERTKMTTLAQVALVESLARAEADNEKRVINAFRSNHVARFAELVNNQPQLAFSAEHRSRDPLVGADETSLKVTWEYGFANVNDFEKESRGACHLLDDRRQITEDDADTCLKAYGTYIEQHANALDAADRVALEASWVKVDDFTFNSPADNVALTRDKTHRLDFSVAYGRTMRVVGDGRDTRVDVVAKYEDYSDDPDHRDRFVATLSFTTKLNGMSIPISLVYANHGKFLPEVDAELSAHIGIKYSLDNVSQ